MDTMRKGRWTKTFGANSGFKLHTDDGEILARVRKLSNGDWCGPTGRLFENCVAAMLAVEKQLVVDGVVSGIVEIEEKVEIEGGKK